MLRSEIDDLDFDLRVVRQVSRNPDFYTTEAVERVYHLIGGRYQSGPGVTVPYDAKRAAAIIQALNDTPAIVAQGAEDLTEPVGQMADMALRTAEGHPQALPGVRELVGQYLPDPYQAQIAPAADAAGVALEKYGDLDQGPSHHDDGTGRDRQQGVRLVRAAGADDCRTTAISS